MVVPNDKKSRSATTAIASKHRDKSVAANDVHDCILVSKSGSLKEMRATELDYIKVCKTPPTYASAFKRHATWTIKKYEATIELWARATGRAGQENKYEFPPPVDETLFFGACLLVSKKTGTGIAAAPLTISTWKKCTRDYLEGLTI